MTTKFSRPWATGTINEEFTQKVADGRLRLDAMGVPYASGTIVLPITELSDIDDNDPRDGIRAKIGVGDDYDGDGDDNVGDARQFNLGIRGRTVNRAQRSVEFSLASDEALLQDYAPLVDTEGARAFQTSIRGVCNYVLSRAITARTNLALNGWPNNSSGAYNEWVARYAWTRILTGSDAVFTAPSNQDSGDRGFDINGGATAGSPGTTGIWSTPTPVKAGKPVTLSLHVASSKSLTWRITLRLHNGAGAWLAPAVVSAAQTNAPGAYTQVSITYTPPAAGFISASVRASTGVAMVTGDTISARRLLIEPGARSVADYFDGFTATMDWGGGVLGNGRYGTEWMGTVGASTSRMFPQLKTSPSPDADVTAYWPVTNEFTNPSPTSTTGYTTGTGTSAVSLVTFASRNAIRWTASGSGAAYCNISAGFSVDPTLKYKVIGEFASSVSRAVGFMVRWLDINGATVKDQLTGTVTTTTSSWTRLSATVTPPKTAVRANVYAVSLTNTSGQFHYLSRLMWYEGNETVDYFDGSTSLPTTYTYAWEDAANLSPSVRTPVFERDPEAFIWPAGTSAWEFLEPLVASVGLRLFCDEQRQWFLINPDTYTAAGVLVLSADTVIEGTDLVELGDPEVYCTGVSIVYTWTDRNGNERTRTDSAGTGGLVLRVEINRPWPGNGVAAWMLSRREGQGRIQEITAISRMFAMTGIYAALMSPAMQVSISLPGTSDQLGQLQAIEWGLTDGLMNVTTRALTDIIPGSIDALTGTIDALTGTIDSL